MSNAKNNQANDTPTEGNTMKATFSYDSLEAAAAATASGILSVDVEIEIPDELSWTDDDGNTTEWGFTGKTGTALKDGRPTAEYEEISYGEVAIGEGRIFIAAINGPNVTEILERVNF